MGVDQGLIERARQEIWGYPEFRPHQRDVIQAIMGGRDTLTILPTGGGKSLCYQLPASLMTGTALVVSPLIALMADQVEALQLHGVPSAFLNSMLSASQARGIREDFQAGRLKLLYVAPERLVQDRFRRELETVPISFVAIDEAHCISHWGHDFRPEYRQLGLLREWLPRCPIHAFTATAPPRVQDDIRNQLHIEHAVTEIGDYFRSNLNLKVFSRHALKQQLRNALAAYGDHDSGIVYCLSRRETEQWSDYFNQIGRRAAPYHAGLDKVTRTQHQNLFTKGQINTMVATIAFGMGIDQSNIRFVIHNGLPKTLAHYQQESGRAGRDGLAADCILFYSLRDYHFWRRIIEEEDVLVEQKMSQLRDMLNYATQIRCRHAVLVQHFGQTFRPGPCGACDVCSGQIQSIPQSREFARMILSAVLRLRQAFGAGYVAQVLTGSRESKIARNGHDQLSVFGLLKSYSKSQVQDWVNQLESQQYLARSDGPYPVMHVTQRGLELLRPDKFETDPESLEIHLTLTRKTKPKAAAKSVDFDYDTVLFERLRGLRRELATQLDVPAFVIFGDRSLQEMSARKPTDLTSFGEVFGVGMSKLERFGPQFVAEIRDYLDTESAG